MKIIGLAKKIITGQTFGTDERNKNSSVNYAITWCHGAPGIGLSRIRANCNFEKKKYVVDSKAAIDTCSTI